MNVIPATILDGFLENPNAVRDWGLSLEFSSELNGKWPGRRTECLSTIDPSFFSYINNKVLSLFFENNPKFQTQLYFQLIENTLGEGWIHQDPNLFTYIIYLSPENEIDCGTSLYELKPTLHYSLTPSFIRSNTHIPQLRNDHHKTGLFPPNLQKSKNQHDTTFFNKILSVKDKYNRLFAFSSENFHSANYLSNNFLPRLTLIGFVIDLSTGKTPSLRSKQTPML